MPRSLTPVLTPHGSLRLDCAEDEFALEDGLAERLESRFQQGAGHGLLQLGAAEAGSSLPPTLTWWRDFAMRFVAGLCTLGEEAQAENRRNVRTPTASDFAAMIDEAPPMRGGEYLRPNVLIALWRDMEQALEIELLESKLPFQDFLKSRDRRWRLVGRVHFNLAENPRDADFPFAFMATYTRGLSANGGLRHQPLGQSLREYAGAGNKAKLLQLLAPVQQASEECAWLKKIVDAGEIFYPLRWTPQDAVRFLHDVEAMERAGLVIRMPANWRMNRPSRPSVEATVGSTSPSVLGMDALLDFRVEVSLDGEVLTDDEIGDLLASNFMDSRCCGASGSRSIPPGCARRSINFRRSSAYRKQKACRSRRPCASWRGRTSAPPLAPHRPRNGRMSEPGHGSPRLSKAAAVPMV